MPTFFVRATGAAGGFRLFQDGSSASHARATVESTGAKVSSITGPLPSDAMPDTIAGYWMLHGYSLEEALQMQKEQIAKAIAQEELYEAMERDVF
jgi:hypothetical protein